MTGRARTMDELERDGALDGLRPLVAGFGLSVHETEGAATESFRRPHTYTDMRRGEPDRILGRLGGMFPVDPNAPPILEPRYFGVDWGYAEPGSIFRVRR